MQIAIQNDNRCWVCNKKSKRSQKLTYHHTLPKHLKPHRNVIVPVCQQCHNKINTTDVAGLHKYAYKLKKETEELSKSIKRFLSSVKDKKNWRL